MDATFRTTPKPYEQIFTVLGDYSGHVVPLITALMTNCTVGDYRQVFQTIKRSVRRITWQQWEPESAVVDFEQALITTLETETSHTHLEGCYFHFNQPFWHHILEAGLVNGYRNDERLQWLLRKVMALGFLPTALVRNNFWLSRTACRIQRLIRRYPVLMDFLAYVHNAYIQGNFGIPFWNVYDRNMDCRTSNKAEVSSWTEQLCWSVPPEFLDLHSAFKVSSITYWKWYYRYGSKRSAGKAFLPLAASWEPTDTAEVRVWPRWKMFGWLLEYGFSFTKSPLTDSASILLLYSIWHA